MAGGGRSANTTPNTRLFQLVTNANEQGLRCRAALSTAGALRHGREPDTPTIPALGRDSSDHRREVTATMPAQPPQHADDLSRVAERLYTIPITCRLDGQAHDVTDASVAAGKRTGEYAALCGYVVSAAPMVAPVGRRCVRCTAVSTPTRALVGRPRHRQHGRLWRLLLPHRHAAVGAITRRLP